MEQLTVNYKISPNLTWHKHDILSPRFFLQEGVNSPSPSHHTQVGFCPLDCEVHLRDLGGAGAIVFTVKAAGVAPLDRVTFGRTRSLGWGSRHRVHTYKVTRRGLSSQCVCVWIIIWELWPLCWFPPTPALAFFPSGHSGPWPYPPGYRRLPSLLISCDFRVPHTWFSSASWSFTPSTRSWLQGCGLCVCGLAAAFSEASGFTSWDKVELSMARAEVDEP